MIARNDWKRLSAPIFIVLIMMLMLAVWLNLLAPVNASSVDLLFDEPEDAKVNAVSAQTAVRLESVQALPANENEKSTYIVVLKDEPLARYSGGVAGFRGTSRQATGAVKLNSRAPESLSYLAYLANRRAIAIKTIVNTLGRELDVSYEYGASIVGFAAEMTAAEAAQVAALDAVSFVELEKISYPQTDAGPVWSGATGPWGGDLDGVDYQASLSGANEVPAVASTATGEATFTYNFYTGELSYDIDVKNPSGITLTAMHIHSGISGTVGSVIANLNLVTTTSSFTQTGSVTLSGGESALLVNTGLYVNIHSDVNGGGEIRGQIELDGTLGEGVVVGVIDTGIDPWNRSFWATGSDGYVHTNPLGAGNYLGVCDPSNSGNNDIVGYDATFPCNDKLIGVWGYTGADMSPRDTDGHGSHTAGTAAGNLVYNSVITAPTKVFTNNVIMGMAPHANIIAYDGCTDGLGCPSAPLAAAREQALLDGVDVVNYSIASPFPSGNLWQTDSEALQWLALREAGIFVAAANGNAGNEPATTDSPADLPWITSVGASSHNRAFAVTLVLTDNNSTTFEVTGQAMTQGYGPAPVVFSNSITDTEDTRLCVPDTFAPNTFNGEIVICENAGLISPIAKGQAVLDAGAGGFVIAESMQKTGGPGSIRAIGYHLPAVHIDYTTYQVLRQFLLTTSVGTVTGELSDVVFDYDDAHGDIMATFSSRGPNRSAGDLIVPNLTAPGRNVWAAYKQGGGGDGDSTYAVIDGTSMASPHVAGAAALLTALHPDWTPAEMESALMLTAFDEVRDDDGVTIASPFAQGSGHINVGAAADSPLVMSVTAADYKAADPSLDNDFEVRDLNIASFGEDACIAFCSWGRTFKNVSSETLTWTLSFDAPGSIIAGVSPTEFSLAPGESQAIGVAFNLDGTGYDGEWRFGSLRLDEMSGNYPNAHLPFAVLPSKGNLPETLEIEAQMISGSVSITELVSLEITDLHTELTGLITADRHELTLLEKSFGFLNVGSFFEDITTTVFVSIPVPTDSFSVIAEVVEADTDLSIGLLFRDVDNNGPDIGDIGDLSNDVFVGVKDGVCMDIIFDDGPPCEILAPTAGTYYVAVISREQVNSEGDFVDLATAVVPNNGTNAGNMGISGSSAVANNTPYTLTVNYSEPTMQAIDKLYGYFTVGTDSGNAGNLATVRVYLDYLGIPDIAIEPETLAMARAASTETLSTTLTVSTTGGVLDWNVDQLRGDEHVEDGGFENAGSSGSGWGNDTTHPYDVICSQVNCGLSLASSGDWYAWLGGAAPNQSYFEQDVTINANRYALLTFDMIIFGPITSTAVLTISLDGEVIETYTAEDFPDYEFYKEETLDVSEFADGGTYTLAFDLKNLQTGLVNVFVDNVSLTSAGCNVVGDIEWLDINPTSGTLSPGATNLTAGFSTGNRAAGVYTDTLCVNSNDPDEPILHVPVVMTITAAVPDVTAHLSSLTATNGESVTYTVRVTNTGSTLDTFNINLSGNVWDSAPSVATLELDAGMTGTFDVVVMIPATATVGATDEVTVTVASQADGTKANTVMLETRVRVYRSFLPLISRN